MESTMVFSYTQLLMFAVLQGYEGVVGLPGFQAENKAEIILGELNTLVKNDFIKTEGNNFVCTEQAAEIGEKLGNSKGYIAVHTINNSVPDFTCYPGKSLMMCSPRRVSQDMAAIRFLSVNELFALLRDEGYAPNVDEALNPDENELEEYEAEYLYGLDPNQPLDENGCVLFSAELTDNEGSSKGFVKVISYYFYKYILTFRDGELKRSRFCAAAFDEAMKGLICAYDNS